MPADRASASVCIRADAHGSHPCRSASDCVCLAVLVQPYIAFDEMLLRGPTTTLSPTRSLQSTINYDMDSHYRFGGVAPQKHRDPMRATLETRLLEFITKEGTPGVMPSEQKLRVRFRGARSLLRPLRALRLLRSTHTPQRNSSSDAHLRPVCPQGAGREDLVKGISGAGGWQKVARTLGLQISHTLREVYFRCPHSKKAGDEIEFTMPGMPQRFAATIPEGARRPLCLCRSLPRCRCRCLCL